MCSDQRPAQPGERVSCRCCCSVSCSLTPSVSTFLSIFQVPVLGSAPQKPWGWGGGGKKPLPGEFTVWGTGWGLEEAMLAS